MCSQVVEVQAAASLGTCDWHPKGGSPAGLTCAVCTAPGGSCQTWTVGQLVSRELENWCGTHTHTPSFGVRSVVSRVEAAGVVFFQVFLSELLLPLLLKSSPRGYSQVQARERGRGESRPAPHTHSLFRWRLPLPTFACLLISRSFRVVVF